MIRTFMVSGTPGQMEGTAALPPAAPVSKKEIPLRGACVWSDNGQL